MATLIRANGAKNEITPENRAEGLTADEIKGLLRGNFLFLPLDLERTIVMNAYPARNSLPKNHRATKLFLDALIDRKLPASEIKSLRGDILVASYSELRLPEVFAAAMLLI